MTTKQLLTAADQLPDDKLDEFTQEVARLAAKRRCPALSSRETELLRHINAEADVARVRRYRELQSKRDSVILDESESHELLELSDWLEETHAERLQAVAELARLRGISLPEMMQQLGIGHLVV